MSKCFVIQPFDGARFDKRYNDVFAPAIEAAGLEPYRVDHDPSVSIPIDDIQQGIEGSLICLVDITTDNPNVWFELGFAIAAQRDVLLVCADERKTPFPFDVHHRSIVTYSTESSSDFNDLREEIVMRLRAKLERSEKLGQVGRIQSVAKLEGLDQHVVATLVAVAEQGDTPETGLSVHEIRRIMENAGFTKIATTLGLRTLTDNGMLESFEDSDFHGNPFIAYRVTDVGMKWLLENQERFTLRQDPPEPMGYQEGDDNIPF